MFRYFLTVIFLFLISCARDENVPEKTFELDKKELNVSYGSDPLQKMDVYFPKDYNKNTPVVFLIHGGGFIAGTKEDFTNVAELFMTRGYVAVNLSHRLVDADGIDQSPPVHKKSTILVVDEVSDVAAAVEKYKALSGSWGTGTSKMYMAGHSAGGTLAMLYVQGNKNKGVRASGNFAGLTNVTLPQEFYTNPPDHEYWPNMKEALYRLTGKEVIAANALALMQISPNWVTVNNKPGKPNITVMSKSNDEDLQFAPFFSSVDDAEKYHKELLSYGTPSAYILMDTDHGFGNHPDDWKTAVQYVHDFFKKN